MVLYCTFSPTMTNVGPLGPPTFLCFLCGNADLFSMHVMMRYMLFFQFQSLSTLIHGKVLFASSPCVTCNTINSIF